MQSLLGGNSLKFFSSIWWPITVGVVYIATMIFFDGGKLMGLIYITALTFMWASEVAVKSMWRKTAYEIAGE